MIDPTDTPPTSTGRITYLPPGNTPHRHRCGPPARWAPDGLAHEPQHPHGTIWRCDCGRSWTAWRGGWRPATLTERAKARLLAHRGPTTEAGEHG